MRPVTLRLSSTGYTPWIPVNRLQANFNVAVAVALSSGASLVCDVQHTFDNMFIPVPCVVTRTTTTANVKLTNHGLSNGDYANVQSTGSSNLDGGQVVTYVDANNFSYAVSNTGATADTGSSVVGTARVFTNLTLNGLTARADGNYVDPVMACRLYVSAWVSGFADITVLQGLGL